MRNAGFFFNLLLQKGFIYGRECNLPIFRSIGLRVYSDAARSSTRNSTSKISTKSRFSFFSFFFKKLFRLLNGFNITHMYFFVFPQQRNRNYRYNLTFLSLPFVLQWKDCKKNRLSKHCSWYSVSKSNLFLLAPGDTFTVHTIMFYLVEDFR